MRLIFCLAISIFFISSCSTLDKSRMLKTPTNYKFKEFADSVNYKKSYRVAVDDYVSLQMFSNNGYSLVSLSGGEGRNNIGGSAAQNQSAGAGAGAGAGQGGMGNQRGNAFKVRRDSTIKVPVLGHVKVVGLTLPELEYKLEEILQKTVNAPFVVAQIFNRRVYIFQGGYQASVIQLQNENTTLFEILAQTGGVYEEGNASRIKIIRGDLKNPDIYLVNLSTIDGMKDADLTMQAGDIIYIDPFINYPSRISNDIGSFMGFFATIILSYTILRQN